MRCAEIKRLIAAGEPPRGSEIEEHLASCGACRALLADDAALARELAAGESPSVGQEQTVPELFGALERQLAAERGVVAWLRSRASATRLALGALVALAVAASALRHPRPDWGSYPRLRLALELVAWVLLAGSAIWIWLRPLHRPAPPRWVPLTLGLATLALPAVLALAPAAHAAHPASLAGAGEDLLRRALPCFIYGAALAAPVVLLLFALGRRARPPLSLSLLVIGAAAAAGLLALHLHCPITHRAHLLLGHATIGPVLLLLLLVGRAVARRR